MRTRSFLPVVVLLAVACTDSRTLTSPGGGGALRTMTPSGTLDQNINALLELFPKGLEKAGTERWRDIKEEYKAGLRKPAEMREAKKMLVELVEWVQKKAPRMDTPPNGESRSAAAARLTLYMSLYIYGGPTTPPPVFLPGADNATGIVTPAAAATIVTPTMRAGVGLPKGSVDENTIIVITENPTSYPTPCSGPLAAKPCQYPRFYKFDQFPHKRLQKAATFAVCHVNAGDSRLPLADHMRFRLAHTKPENEADKTPGSEIRDQNGENVEILPYITQTFSVCDDVEYALAERATGIRGVFAWLGHTIGHALTPRNAYAIDQGGGGEGLTFSDFNVLDPLSQPDNSVYAGTYSDTAPHPGDQITSSFTVKNVGTATSEPVPATVRLSTTNAITPADLILGTVTIPALAPGASTTISSLTLTVPAATVPGLYFAFIQVGANPGLAELSLANNSIGPQLMTINQRVIEVETLTGDWTGTYAWNCGTPERIGSTSITFSMLATENPAQYRGVASYLNGSSGFTLTRYDVSGQQSPTGPTIGIIIDGGDGIVSNEFTGTISGSRINGTTLNGDSDAPRGCSAPTGRSGTFTIDKVITP